MSLAEAYSLFIHGLNPQLRQLAGTMVTSGNLDEVIEIVKKAMVYGEDKGESSQQKPENKQKRQSGGKGGGKGNKGNWGPSGRPVVRWVPGQYYYSFGLASNGDWAPNSQMGNWMVKRGSSRIVR